MADISSLLRGAVQGVNENFERARIDLFELIGELSKGVASLTGNAAAQLVLNRAGDSDTGRIYQLLLTYFGNHPLLFYYVPISGYPIYVGSTAGAPMPQAEALSDRPALENQIATLASNPSSPLVVKLAFLMRQAKP